MKPRYRITPQGQGSEPSDQELRRYGDAGRLLHNYQRARDALHARPLCKQPRIFAVLLIILLLAWLLSEASREQAPAPPPDQEQAAP